MDKELFYDTIAHDFDRLMNPTELRRRLEIVFGVLLEEDIVGKLVLDAGCGTGWFSQKAKELGAKVVSLDISERLLLETAIKCDSLLVAGDVQRLPMPSDIFDLAISSEVVEHTRSPEASVRELIRVLRPGGVLFLTTPNKVWRFSVEIANWLNIRRYHGFENWVGWPELRRLINSAGGEVETVFGFNFLPLYSKFLSNVTVLLEKRFARKVGFAMVNIAVRVRKKA